MNFIVTPQAISKINESMNIRQPIPLGVRIFVYSDENNNILHSMSFVDVVSSADKVFQVSNITFIVDMNSKIFLENVVLDYVIIGAAQGFVFQSACEGKSCFNCQGACRV